MSGVDVFRDGSFLAVIADREEVAAEAAGKLAAAARWESGPLTPASRRNPPLSAGKRQRQPARTGRDAGGRARNTAPDAARCSPHTDGHLLPALSDAWGDGSIRRHRTVHERRSHHLLAQPGRRNSETGAGGCPRARSGADPRDPCGGRRLLRSQRCRRCGTRCGSACHGSGTGPGPCAVDAGGRARVRTLRTRCRARSPGQPGRGRTDRRLAPRELQLFAQRQTQTDARPLEPAVELVARRTQNTPRPVCPHVFPRWVSTAIWSQSTSCRRSI